MTIEIALLISVVSMGFGIFFGIIGMRRNQKKDDADEASKQTTIFVKLENISAGISEIKSEMFSIKCDLREQRERLAVVEEATKAAHKRIDEFRKKKEDY